MKITTEFKHKVVAALLELRPKFTGPDNKFAQQWGINPGVWSQLKNGSNPEGLLRDSQWLQMGRKLDVSASEKTWVIVRTEVLESIERDVTFCKKHSKAMMMVDDAEIGKTVAGKYLAKKLENCFYVDCSQAKSKHLFIRSLARAIGVDPGGKLADVKADLKYYLQILPAPVVVVDEAGDLDYPAFLELKELWNATEGQCGWYMMGAEGLQTKFRNGISNKKAGYRETYSRYGSRFRRVTPKEKTERTAFYRQLITDVATANAPDKNIVPELVKRAIIPDEWSNIGGLRRLESLIILSNEVAA